jgi:hypothetical protein
MVDAPRFKTAPYAHQIAAVERFKDSAYAALFFEQRLGKAKTALDLAAHHHRARRIKTLLLVSPNGVHYQWVKDAVPEHLPDDVKPMMALWDASRIKQKGVRKHLRDLLNYTDGLRVLSINIDAIRTKEFADRATGYANALFRAGGVMTVIDESSDLSSDKSMRTQAAVKLGRASRVRLILDGTPAAAGPLGLYGQCLFLSPDALGFRSFMAFKAHFAELERKDFGERDRPCPDCKKTGWVPGSLAGNGDVEVKCLRCWGTGFVGRTEAQVIKTHVDQNGEAVKSYKNLDELKAKLDRFSVRLTRDECYDLPPKIYERIYFDLDAASAKVYQDLRDKYVTELKNGDVVTATMVLTRYIRLQQVASGFLPTTVKVTPCPTCASEGCDDCGWTGVVEDGSTTSREVIGDNSRLTAYLTAIEKLTGQGIIWARFDHDVDALVAAGRDAGRRVVRYDGRVSDRDKAAAVAAFQAGEADWFVAKQRSAGRGHDLARANWMVYYSHDWSLRMRLQSEDRAQSLKKLDSVLYMDFVARDTVDEKIVAALRAKKSLSDQITGDPMEEWI